MAPVFVGRNSESGDTRSTRAPGLEPRVPPASDRRAASRRLDAVAACVEPTAPDALKQIAG